jgi:hypothetical protein
MQTKETGKNEIKQKKKKGGRQLRNSKNRRKRKECE